MASTYSPSARTELPATGDQNNTWAATVDNNWNVPIEKFIAGVANVALPDANYTLTTGNAVADEARMAVLSLTGALTATRDVYIPAVPKLYIVKNGANRQVTLRINSSAGTVTDAGIPQPYSVTSRSGSSSTTVASGGVPIPAGTTVYVYSDGVTVDHCLAGTGPALVADSFAPTTPLSIVSGGTNSTGAVAAQATIGLGTAATLNAASGNSGNTVVQRDGFGNFVAGTITAGLNGTADTSTNTSLFNNLGPSAYQFIGTSPQWVNLPFSNGNPNNFDLYNNYGAGTYCIWWQALTDLGVNRFAFVTATPNGSTVRLNSSNPVQENQSYQGQHILMTGGTGPFGTAGVMLGFAKLAIHQ